MGAARGSPTRCNAYATGHQRDTGCPCCVEHRRRERVVGTQLRQRVKTKARGFNRRVERIGQIVGLDLRDGAGGDVTSHHRANCIRIGAIADGAERLGGTSLHDRFCIVECLEQRGTRRGIGQQPERECRHLPHFELFVRQQTSERLDRRGKSDTPGGQRSTTTDARFRIAQQTNEIRWLRRRDERRFRSRRRSQE